MKRKTYILEEYNENWPKMFQDESQKILQFLEKEVLQTEHIGSTSILGMIAKPTVDILFIVSDLNSIKEYVSEFENIGYEGIFEYIGENTWIFMKNEGENRLFNVHIMQKGHWKLEGILALRDYLRVHLDEKQRYIDMKRSLFKKSNEYSIYRKEKTPLVEELQEKAVAWSRENKNN